MSTCPPRPRQCGVWATAQEAQSDTLPCDTALASLLASLQRIADTPSHATNTESSNAGFGTSAKPARGCCAARNVLSSVTEWLRLLRLRTVWSIRSNGQRHVCDSALMYASGRSDDGSSSRRYLKGQERSFCTSVAVKLMARDSSTSMPARCRTCTISQM